MTEIPVFSSLLLLLSPILLSSLFSDTPSLGRRYEILKAVTECCYFMGRDAVQSGRNLSTFHRKLVSTLRVTEYARLPRKLQIQGRENTNRACVWAIGRWLPRRWQYSEAPASEPQISLNLMKLDSRLLR